MAAVVWGGFRVTAPWRAQLEARSDERARAAVAMPLEAIVRGIEAAEERGDIAAIEQFCDALVTHHAEDPLAEPALLRLVQARLKRGDGRGAARALQDLQTRYPKSELLAEAILDVAMWQFGERAFREAAGRYTDLVALVTSGDGRAPVFEDTAPEPIIWRSKKLWNEHKRAERSRTELERLARFNQALCYERAGDREAALRAYDRFLSRFPHDAHVPEARFRMAALLEAENRVAEALPAYQAVYSDALAPVSYRSESLYRVGRLYQTARRFEEATAVYRQALPLVPADNEFRLAALSELAALLETREPAQALAIYRELSASSASTAVRAGALQRLAAMGANATPATSPPALTPASKPASKPAPASTPAKPVATTDKAAHETEKPPSAIEKATLSAAKPAIPTTKAAGTDKPAAATEKPAAAADKPATATEKPTAATDKPAPATDKPAAAADMPATANPKPNSTTTSTPASKDDVSSSASDKPASTTTAATPAATAPPAPSLSATK